MLLISADLAEILSLADRIVVLYRGRIVGELAGAEATEMNVGLLMAGVRPRGVDEPPDPPFERARSRRGAGCDRADRRPGTSMSGSTASIGPARWDARGVLVAVLVPIVAIALALAIGGFVVILAGADPWAAYVELFRGAVGTPGNLSATVARSVPDRDHGPRDGLRVPCRRVQHRR